jgi:hypothetical protein
MYAPLAHLADVIGGPGECLREAIALDPLTALPN